MTKKQLIDTCKKLRPTAREWRDAVTRHVDYFEGHAGFDFENWEKDKFIEARGIVAGIMEKTVRHSRRQRRDRRGHQGRPSARL